MSPVGIRLPDRFTHLLESMGLPLPSVVTVATMEKSSETEKISNSINKRILIGLALEEDLMRFHATASLQFYIGTFLATIISRGFVPEEFSGTVLLQYLQEKCIYHLCTLVNKRLLAPVSGYHVVKWGF